MSRPIPEVRADMIELAREMRMQGFDYWADKLATMAEDTRRAKPVKPRAASTSAVASGDLCENTRRYVARYPTRSAQEVANRFKVNPGRVTEALQGKR